MFEISQRFFFDAAHTLRRELGEAGHGGADPEATASRRVHGHTYHAEVFVTGPRDAGTGMVLDLGLVRREIATVRDLLDHHFLDEVPGLGTPTLENLCVFIHGQLRPRLPGLSAVSVWRDALGDRCIFRPV